MCFHPASLWNSYIFAPFLLSKTYGSRWHFIGIAGEIRLPSHSAHQESSMLDIVMLALGLGFFVLSVGYAYACERL